MCAHFLMTSAEKKGVRPPAVKKGLKVSPTRHYRRLILNQEEKELAVRPILPGTFHSMDAVRKHTLSIGSEWGQTPSQIGFSHTLWRKPTPATRAETSNTNFPHTHTSRLCPAQQLDRGGTLPKVLILSCFFPGCCLHAWGRSILLLHLWLPSFSRGLLLFGPPVASSPPQPCSLLCKHRTSLPSLLLRRLMYNA